MTTRPSPGVPEALSLQLREVSDTARLRLRKPTLDDASSLFNAYGTDPDVTRYLRWRPKKDAAEMADFLRFAIGKWEERSEFHHVVELRDPRTPIGMISAVPGDHGVELGYVLARSYWGQGFMTEAAEALVEELKQDPSVYRIWAFTDVENEPSARVLERLGFEREAVLARWVVHPNISPTPRDVVVYRVLTDR